MRRGRFERLERVEKNVINEQVKLTEEELRKQRESSHRAKELMDQLFADDYI